MFSLTSTDNKVLKVLGLETKFDTSIVSNSLVMLLEDYLEARIVQQLHYWGESGYGVVINGVTQIYKPIREWIAEVFPGSSSWKLRKAISNLIEKGILNREKLFVKHHEQEHNSPWWHPKNQTYYYSLNYDKLQELVREYESARTSHNGEPNSAPVSSQTPENVRIVESTKLSVEDFQDTKYCDYSQNNTKNTSIENYSKDKSHPTLPCECEISKPTSQEEEQFSNPELPNNQVEKNKAGYKVIEQDITSANVEEKVNQYKSINEQVVQENVQEQETVQVASASKPIIKPKTPKGTKSRRKNQAPWKDEGQFKRFYRALIQALPIVANAHSPQGLAQTIIRQLRCGIPHSYWDDFKAGVAIGTSTKPEWEIEPGVPYPQFIEYLTEKLKRGDNTTTDEQTRNEVFRILNKPRQAKAFWGQFKRSVVNVSEQIERDRALGVSNPSTPVWTRERIEPSISEAATAGHKIMAVNGATQTAIEAATNPQLESIEPLRGLKAPEFISGDSPFPKQLSESLTPDPWMDEEEKTKSSPHSGDSGFGSLTMSELLTKRLGVRNLKGFTKQMPKVSQAEAKAESKALTKRKTNISQMTLAEINDYLQEPILRQQITPQLMTSDYELITDELGQIISVKPKPE